VGETALVEWQYGYFACTVRSCEPDAAAWRIGVALEQLPAHRVLLPDLQQRGLS
jgi:hypothetical protein